MRSQTIFKEDAIDDGRVRAVDLAVLVEVPEVLAASSLIIIAATSSCHSPVSRRPSEGTCRAKIFPVEAALGFRSPKFPSSRLACSLSAPPFVGTPDCFLCGDCLFGFSPVPDPRLVPAPISFWNTGAGTQEPVRSCAAGDPENTALRRPCLDETPDSRLHACLPGTTDEPDRTGRKTQLYPR